MFDPDLLIQAGGLEKSFQKNDFIFHEDSEAFHFFKLLSGRLKLVNVDDNGKEDIHDIINPGQYAGNFSLNENENYYFSAIAETELKLIKISVTDLRNFLAANPEFLLTFSNYLAQKYRYALFISKIRSYKTPEESIVDYILHLKDKKHNICKTCGKLLLTRKQIGSVLGLRVETVIRSMKTLEEKEFLKIIKGKVYLKYFN